MRLVAVDERVEVAVGHKLAVKPMSTRRRLAAAQRTSVMSASGLLQTAKSCTQLGCFSCFWMNTSRRNSRNPAEMLRMLGVLAGRSKKSSAAVNSFTATSRPLKRACQCE